MAPHWKCGSGQPVAGSNPALSAISARRHDGHACVGALRALAHARMGALALVLACRVRLVALAARWRSSRFADSLLVRTIPLPATIRVLEPLKSRSGARSELSPLRPRSGIRPPGRRMSACPPRNPRFATPSGIADRKARRDRHRPTRPGFVCPRSRTHGCAHSRPRVPPGPAAVDPR